MKGLLLALQFLTIIPVKLKDIDESDLSKSTLYFPIIGLLLGLVLIGINSLFVALGFLEFYINIILVVSLIVLTSGIHLDGLADTADALLSRKSRREMLEIMRDSHIGVMGVLGLFCVILLKIALISSISPSLKITSLLLMCVLSRWSLVFAIFLFPYARQEGKAKAFFQGINFKIFILATITALIFTITIYKINGVLLFGIIMISVFVIGRLLSKKIGGITGDVLGAINEFIEIITLFGICILRGGGHG